MTEINRTALVTGANSGLGFEAAAQLAESGYGRVILGCRSEEKGAAARAKLLKRTGNDVFEILVIDVSEFESSSRAAQTLIDQPGSIDLLILNAGVISQSLLRNSDGIEITLATALFGNHILTMKLIEAGKLSGDAHIVLAGSEAARGSVPMPGMRDMLYDYSAIKAAVGGDMVSAMEAVARGEQPGYNVNNAYCNAKIWIAWWAAVLARNLPAPMVVVVISPGSNPGTNMARSLPFMMRMMMPIMRLLGPLLKMATPVAVGAKRYLDGSEFGPEASGKFWASPPGRLIGQLEVQPQEHLYDQGLQSAAWQSLVNLTGIGLPASLEA